MFPQMSNNTFAPQQGQTPMLRNGGGSIGGQQNIPQLFGLQGANPAPSFGGYNASIANSSPSWMGGLLGAGGTLTSPILGTGYQPPSQLNNPNNLGGNLGYLNSIASGQGAGAPVSQVPAWQQMVQAQQYNIQQGADQLAEQFNNGGGLFSTAYGNAAGQYQQQARLGENAQLTAAQTQALQAANQNQLTAAQQLSSQGYGAANTAAQLGTQSSLAQLQNQLGLQNLAVQAGSNLGTLGLENLTAGNTLGNSQLLAQQNQLTAQYQNWYNQQPQNNPLISLMYSGIANYPELAQPTYNPGSLGSILGGLGGLAGGAGTLLGGLGLIGLSDKRLKKDIKKIGERAGVNVYQFRFINDEKQILQMGYIAQEVYERYPQAVIVGDEKNPWMIDYAKLYDMTGGIA